MSTKRRVLVTRAVTPAVSVTVNKPPRIRLPTKPVQASAPTPKRGRPPANRIVHEVETLYDGDSRGLNARKSTTKLDLALFNTRPKLVLTSRTELVLQAVKDKYGRHTFARGNIDAGVLKYAIMKGHLQPVSGDGTENTMLRFTGAGLNYVAGQENRKSKTAA